MQQFIQLVERLGYFALYLSKGTPPGYQARRENGHIRAILHTADRRDFWVVTIPEADVIAGDEQAVRAAIESRRPIVEGKVSR